MMYISAKNYGIGFLESGAAYFVTDLGWLVHRSGKYSLYTIDELRTMFSADNPVYNLAVFPLGCQMNTPWANMAHQVELTPAEIRGLRAVYRLRYTLLNIEPNICHTRVAGQLALHGNDFSIFIDTSGEMSLICTDDLHPKHLYEFVSRWNEELQVVSESAPYACAVLG